VRAAGEELEKQLQVRGPVPVKHHRQEHGHHVFLYTERGG
jgi:hypothetical protein